MRQSGESYEVYRKRLKREQREMKRKLNGKVFHNVHSYRDEDGKWIPGKGTFKK